MPETGPLTLVYAAFRPQDRTNPFAPQLPQLVLALP